MSANGGEVFMRSRPECVNGLNAWTVEHIERLEHREHLEHKQHLGDNKSVAGHHAQQRRITLEILPYGQ